jgi:type IV secretory pathway TraG/TraD family ATPase VirD4
MSESKQNHDDGAILAIGLFVGIAVAVIAAFLTVVKYAAPILTGVFFGWSALIVTYRAQWAARVRGVGFVFLALGLILFICFGLPIETGMKPGSVAHFMGVLWAFDWYWDFIIYCVTTWNENIPNIFNIRKMFVVNLKTINVFTIAGYAWIAMPTAVVVFILFGSLRLFGRLRTLPGQVQTALASAAEFSGSFFFRVIFSSWLVRGRELSANGSIVSALVYVAIMGGIGVLVAMLLISRMTPSDLSLVLTGLIYAPGVGAILGCGLGLSKAGAVFIDELFGVSGRVNAERQLESGFTLGVRRKTGHAYRLTERNLSYHVQAVAPTGGGKTTLLKNLIANRIERGYGVIFLDFKAEFDTVSWLYRAAKASNRADDIRLLSLSHRELSVPYNPIQYGDRADIHSALMNAMTWSESYYRSIASQALMTLLSGLCEYRDKAGYFFHLGHVYELLDNPGKLRAFADELGRIGGTTSAKVAELAARIDKKDGKRDIGGLLANLYQLTASAAGELLCDDVVSGSFDFKEAIEERRIVYMLMNSLKLKESASVFGKLILQDLMHYVGEHYSQVERKEPQPIALIIDEFASFATPQFIEFMDRARGAGIGIVLAHQSRADLRTISPEFQERIEANSNTVIVSGITSSQDAEHYAGRCGTQTTKKETRQVERGIFWDHDTGIKSVRDVEEYVVHPNELKQLQQGEFFVHSKIVDPQWGLIRINRACEYEEMDGAHGETSAHLRGIRANYQAQGNRRYLDLERFRIVASAALCAGAQKTETENWD